MTAAIGLIETEILRDLSAGIGPYVRLNLSDIARRCGVSQSTVSRRAKAMREAGILSLRRPGRYRTKLAVNVALPPQQPNNVLLPPEFQARLEAIEGRLDVLADISAWIHAVEGRIEQVIERIDAIIRGQGQAPEIRDAAAPRGRESSRIPEVPPPPQTQREAAVEIPETQPPTKASAEAPIKDNNPPTTNQPVPVEAILQLFREILPSLPSPRGVTPWRQSAVTKRWEEMRREGQFKVYEKDGCQGTDAGLEYFRDFFRVVAICPFLMGQSTSSTWQADFDWLMKPRNFTKVIEGAYLKPDRQEGLIPITSQRDELIIGSLSDRYGKAAVDAAALEVVREGHTPYPSRVSKHLKTKMKNEDAARDFIQRDPDVKRYFESLDDEGKAAILARAGFGGVSIDFVLGRPGQQHDLFGFADCLNADYSVESRETA